MEKLMMNEYTAIQARRRQTTNSRQSRLLELSPEYAAMMAEYQRLCGQAAAAISEGGYEAAKAEMENYASTMDDKLTKILSGLNLPADYLEPVYDCPICMDTGYVGGTERRLCSCARQRKNRKQSDLSHMPCFDEYDEGIFRDDEQKQRTGKLRDFLIKYAENFPDNDKPNLYINSKAGLGKTFLLGCTARMVGERGFGVNMLTAYELTNLFKGEHIEQQPCMGKLKSVDFLVIDDLGVEPIYKNISVEYLYILLNERNRRHKPTAISTNLPMNDLLEKYGERIMSRVMDKSIGSHFGLTGSDLRLNKRQ